MSTFIVSKRVSSSSSLVDIGSCRFPLLVLTHISVDKQRTNKLIRNSMRIVVTLLLWIGSSVSAFRVVSTKLSTQTSQLLASKCGNYDFDVAIIGCGVGGHGAALHARSQGLETAVFVGGDVGGSTLVSEVKID